MARSEELRPNAIVRGSVFPEPVQVSVVVPMGDCRKLLGKGLRSGKFCDPVLSAAQVGQLEVTPEQPPFNGDAASRLGESRITEQVDAQRFRKITDATLEGLARTLTATGDRIEPRYGKLGREYRSIVCRRAERERERRCTIADVQHRGSAWVLPHPDRLTPAISPMVRDPEIERIAVQAAIAYEQSRGWVVESVEADNRGFDLISHRLHPEDPKTAIEIRFIEVKGRAGVGEVALTTNEYRTAERLQRDYWLYVVYDCGSTPEVHAIQNPARRSWEPAVRVQHYHVGASSIPAAEK